GTASVSCWPLCGVEESPCSSGRCSRPLALHARRLLLRLPTRFGIASSRKAILCFSDRRLICPCGGAVIEDGPVLVSGSRVLGMLAQPLLWDRAHGCGQARA